MRERFYRLHRKESPSKKTLTKKLANLKAENKKLKAEVRNIKKLSIMFHAMSVDERYGYNHLQAKNEATRLIVSATAALDEEERLKVSENTVRKWLATAMNDAAKELERIKKKERRQRKTQPREEKHQSAF